MIHNFNNRNRTFSYANPLALIYESKCRDCSVKPNKDQMELFIKSQKEEGKLLLSY